MNQNTQQPVPFLELVIDNARLVQGHPLESQQRKKEGAPVFREDNTPSMEVYFAIAVAKGAEVQQAPQLGHQPQDAWKGTVWGAQIVERAAVDWPTGEYLNPIGFAWKIEDGDSQFPNQNGKKNCDREGFPGHWIIKGTTGLGIKVWDGTNPVGAMREIIDKNELKCGDYGSAAFQVKGNSPAKSKGMYINPTAFMFTRAGAQIISSAGTDSATLFGRATAPAMTAAPNVQSANVAQGMPAPATGGAAIAPVNAAIAPATAPAPMAMAAASSVPPAAVPAVAPHNDFLNVGGAAAQSVAPVNAVVPVAPPAIAPAVVSPVEPSYLHEGQTYTKSALVGFGFTEAHFATMQQV